MKSRPVKDCMIYVVFTRRLIGCKQQVKVVRFANEKRAAAGIKKHNLTWWHAIAAVQGRQRNIEGLEEEV